MSKHTVYTVSRDALERDADRLERDAQQSLRAWILLGQTDRYSEQMHLARAIRNAAACKSIYTRREILRNSGVQIVKL